MKSCCKIWQGPTEVGGKQLTNLSPKNYRVKGREGEKMGGNKMTASESTVQQAVCNFRNKMSKEIISKDTKSFPPLTACFPVAFYWHETADEDLYLGKWQRGLYLGMPSCSAANEKNPYMTSFDRYVHTQLIASFASLLTHIHHKISMYHFYY